MSTIPDWVGAYIGLPYADKGRDRSGVDCYGLVKLILAEVSGIALPDYSGAYTTADDHNSVADAVDAGLRDGWQRVKRPQALDLLILRIAARPWHTGLMVNAGMFIHCPPPGRDGHQSFSCIERLDNPQWAKRIEGFYRCTIPASN